MAHSQSAESYLSNWSGTLFFGEAGKVKQCLNVKTKHI